tara:strand:+ start:3682 stop:4188 length:507 start_codon:yes stop_codon:yes gene_type:complete
MINNIMKNRITIPLTLIRHYLTEGQLAVLTSHNKRQLKGEVVFSDRSQLVVGIPKRLSASIQQYTAEYSINYKKLHYNESVNGDNIPLYYSGNVNIISPQIDFAGAYHNIELDLSLKRGKVENVSVNSSITYKDSNAIPFTPFRSNYENRCLELLKRLLSRLKSLFKK